MKELIIHPYHSEFPEMFEGQRRKIASAIGDFEIHHIGSTAVPGLGGKGIIDIMIAIEKWKQAGVLIENLKQAGFLHVHAKENGRIFASNKQASSFADFHLHIVKKGSKEYKELLFFRDYMRGNKREVERLYKLKLKWCEQTKKDRELYGTLKQDYVKEILKKH